MARPKSFVKEEVLDRAVSLFWQRGFHATSISQLIDHLGINRASLYDTFGGKEALFQQAFQRYRDQNKELTRKLLESHDSVKEAFRTMLYLALEEPDSASEPRGCFVVNATAELLPEEKWLKKILEQNRQEFVQMFSDMIRSGQQKREISDSLDAQAIGTMIFTFYSGIKIMTKIHENGQELRSSIDATLSVLDR